MATDYDDDDSTQLRSAVQRCCEGDPALQAVQKETRQLVCRGWQQPKSLEKWNRNSVTQRGCKISFIVAFFTSSIRTPVVTFGNRVRHMPASPKAPQVTAKRLHHGILTTNMSRRVHRSNKQNLSAELSTPHHHKKINASLIRSSECRRGCFSATEPHSSFCGSTQCLLIGNVT